MHDLSIFWFTNDLRLDDNRALKTAVNNTKKLLCIYIIDPALFKPNIYTTLSITQHRWRFLYESLTCLKKSLQKLNQDLLIFYQPTHDVIADLLATYKIDAIYRSQNAGCYENHSWQKLQEQYTSMHFEEAASHTIFTKNNLPVSIQALPETYTKFRKIVEPTIKNLALDHYLLELHYLPPKPQHIFNTSPNLPIVEPNDNSFFVGGSKAAQKQLDDYFSSAAPSQYKKVRNALDGWENSTKFSAWLANGSISVHRLLNAVYEYEKNFTANESTYWIIFELLWREYFQWYAHTHGARLFRYTGIRNKKILTSFYPERFQRWCQGNTPYPIVNACMKQLNATGYMSNRGRQIVASCFVNELQLDWRYGAAYFEQQLIDYDVAINWGNWQYLAGVGADPRGSRHFDLQKQTKTYDPEKEFIHKWQGETTSEPLDSVDAADWPIE